MATKLCKANVGTRTAPRECGQPIAKGMLAACADHRTAMIATDTPGIFYRGGRYVVVTRHRGRQVKSFHEKWSEAREAKGDRTGSARPAPQKKEPFDTYARAWINDYQGRTSRGFDEDTRASYERSLELYAIPHFRSTPLRAIDRKAINALVGKLRRQGLAPTSISKYLAPVRALFSDAVGNGHLTANPALRLAINAKVSTADHDDEPKRHKEMSRAELAAVLAAIPDRTDGRDPLFFAVLAGTGCRISEALGLDWSDLGQDGATLRIERQWYRGKLKRYTKTANGHRTISLSPDLGRKLWERGADATGPMFATRTGKRLSARNMSRVLGAAAKAANVPHVSPHSFRHSHGSILLDERWPITDVAHRLGDDVQTVSKTYAHKLRDSERDLGFLDSLGNVGNGWATQHPETAAKPASLDSAEMSA